MMIEPVNIASIMAAMISLTITFCFCLILLKTTIEHCEIGLLMKKEKKEDKKEDKKEEENKEVEEKETTLEEAIYSAQTQWERDYALGEYYTSKKQWPLALKYHERAAEQGYYDAIVALHATYISDIEAVKDVDKALKYAKILYYITSVEANTDEHDCYDVKFGLIAIGIYNFRIVKDKEAALRYWTSALEKYGSLTALNYINNITEMEKEMEKEDSTHLPPMVKGLDGVLIQHEPYIKKD